ncbi:hypothetical protein O181_007314 [Austropuccinia psidii MF-1]|uniref:Uncharacterized protein n=1 Tax=Austropuccinia psidii MF-1 TaxID=1389203 RepID=A0A9Q3BLQ2_9BASI|nr:hypothetical protein [Austropuccinia psidii MF-1]
MEDWPWYNYNDSMAMSNFEGIDYRNGSHFIRTIQQDHEPIILRPEAHMSRLEHMTTRPMISKFDYHVPEPQSWMARKQTSSAHQSVSPNPPSSRITTITPNGI